MWNCGKSITSVGLANDTTNMGLHTDDVRGIIYMLMASKGTYFVSMSQVGETKLKTPHIYATA